MQEKYRPLFEPCTLGELQLSNRIALAPTYVGMADSKGGVTDQTLCYYYARAKGGCSLIIVEGTGVTGKYAFAPNYGLSLAGDGYIPGFRDLATVIHWGGAKAIVQIMMGQGAQALHPYGQRDLVAPSDIPALVQKEDLPVSLKSFSLKEAEPPRPLEIKEIEYLKEAMALASMRAKKAGFDGVEIHGAHGYLLGQFTSPYYNRRSDEYGGSPQKRWKLSLELIREIKERAGDRFIVGYRFSAREWIQDGLDLEESTQMAQALEKAGVDYLSVSGGCYGATTRTIPREEGSFVEDASIIKAAVSTPVICANFQMPDTAAEAVFSRKVDFVALSRPLLCDPFWPQKIKDGVEETINRCIRCYSCIRSFNLDQLPVRCSINPMLGYERFDPQSIPRPL
ncbi:MAG: NADH:flavin oxidoreductase [Syntrophobacteraceae bacterium]